MPHTFDYLHLHSVDLWLCYYYAMRIALDITPLFQDQLTGVARYTAALVRAISLHQPKHHYILYGVCPRGLRAKAESLLGNIAPKSERKIIYAPKKVHDLFLRHAQVIPNTLMTIVVGQIHVNHQFDGLPLMFSRVNTATVFDLSAQKHPHWHSKENLAIQSKRLEAIRRSCQHFFPISETTGAEIESEWRLNKSRISVVYPPFDKKLQLQPPCIDSACLVSTNISPALLQERNYILTVATREPRKNMIQIIKAYAQLDRSFQKDHALIIAGAKGWSDLETDDVKQGNIILTDYVCDTCLSMLYQHAMVFVYTSHYEGFGMPIAEAMMNEVPVICSDIPVFREIAGDAAYFVTTQNIPALTTALREVINYSKHERTQITGLGLEQMNAFSAEKSASAMVNAWASLVQSGHENRSF